MDSYFMKNHLTNALTEPDKTTTKAYCVKCTTYLPLNKAADERHGTYFPGTWRWYIQHKQT